MKTSPESFIVDEALCLNYKSFFISGNDEGYIFALMSILVKSFINSGFIKKTLNSNEDVAPDLFKLKNKYVYVCEKYLDGLFFEKNTYWFLLDLLDSRYAILEKELEKILLLENKNNTLELANVLNMNRLTDANKFFFKLRLNKADVTSFLNSSITSLSDFYGYFSYFKIYSLLLFESKNKAELESKIPRYLFKEKQSLLSLFDSLNENKKGLLSSLVFKTERLVRKNPSLFKPLFFRFVLNYKKIIS
jgi:hypothetical protein